MLYDGSYEEASAFIAALRDGTPLAPTLEDAVPSLELCFRLADQWRESDPQDPWAWQAVSP
jgi:hypothetical protein